MSEAGRLRPAADPRLRRGRARATASAGLPRAPRGERSLAARVRQESSRSLRGAGTSSVALCRPCAASAATSCEYRSRVRAADFVLCMGRRMAEGAALMVDHVLLAVGYRQWVMSFEGPLAARLGYDRALLAKVAERLARAVMQDMRWSAKERHGLATSTWTPRSRPACSSGSRARSWSRRRSPRPGASPPVAPGHRFLGRIRPANRVVTAAPIRATPAERDRRA